MCSCGINIDRDCQNLTIAANKLWHDKIGDIFQSWSAEYKSCFENQAAELICLFLLKTSNSTDLSDYDVSMHQWGVLCGEYFHMAVFSSEGNNELLRETRICMFQKLTCLNIEELTFKPGENGGRERVLSNGSSLNRYFHCIAELFSNLHDDFLASLFATPSAWAWLANLLYMDVTMALSWLLLDNSNAISSTISTNPQSSLIHNNHTNWTYKFTNCGLSFLLPHLSFSHITETFKGTDCEQLSGFLNFVYKSYLKQPGSGKSIKGMISQLILTQHVGGDNECFELQKLNKEKLAKCVQHSEFYVLEFSFYLLNQVSNFNAAVIQNSVLMEFHCASEEQVGKKCDILSIALPYCVEDKDCFLLLEKLLSTQIDACLSHTSDDDFINSLNGVSYLITFFNNSSEISIAVRTSIEKMLSFLVTYLKPCNCDQILSVKKWICLTKCISTLVEFQSKYDVETMTATIVTIVGYLFQFAFVLSPEQSAVVGLRIYQSTDDTSLEVLVARKELLGLWSALLGHSDTYLHEFSASFRERIFNVCFNSFVDAYHHRDFIEVEDQMDMVLNCMEIDRLLEIATSFCLQNSWDTISQDGVQWSQFVLQSFSTAELYDNLVCDVSSTGSTKQQRDQHTKHQLMYAIVEKLILYENRTYAVKKFLTEHHVDDQEEVVLEQQLVEQFLPLQLRNQLHKYLKRNFVPANSNKSKMMHLEKYTRNEIYHIFLLWNTLLNFFFENSKESSLQEKEKINSPFWTSALGSYLQDQQLFGPFLSLCMEILNCSTYSNLPVNTKEELLSCLPRLLSSHESPKLQTTLDQELVHLAACSFYRTVCLLPAMTRQWWNDECSRSLRSFVAKYTEEVVSPLILQEELARINEATGKKMWDTSEMTVKGSRVSREIITVYKKDECALEMTIRLPLMYPLRNVEVECTKALNNSEERWRRWVLQIIKLTSTQDGSILEAVLLWQQNVDKEFEGVEDCPICYSILNPKTMALPKYSCSTCKNKFHHSCLLKWVKSSGKNECPMCRQPLV